MLVRIALAYLFFAAFICLIAAAEMAFPREPVMSPANRMRVILFAAIFIPAVYASSSLFDPLRISPLLPFGGIVAAALGADFVYYWYHRAQHSVPWLWRFHAVHHSIEKMGAGSGYHHLLEAPMKGLLVGIPAGALFGGQGYWLGILTTLHGYYVHSTTRISWGRLAWIVCDNRVHRIHHSRLPQHFDRNFGVVTLLWDRLFGTAYFPAAGEWPDVGLDERPEPKTLREWLATFPVRQLAH